MKRENVCKFPISLPGVKGLTVYRFVREGNVGVLQMPLALTSHRALLCAEGTPVLLVGDMRLCLRRGSLCFLMAGESVRLLEGDAPVFLYIDFDGPRTEELFRRFDITPLSRLYHGLDGLIPHWEEALFRSAPATLDLAAESLLLHTLCHLYREELTEGGLIGRIIALTEEQFSDPALSLARVAEALSYHPKYLSHLFKVRTGIGYTEYLRTVRLRYATALLDRGIDSVKNVALLSGFSDPLYFSTVFKKSIGRSPREYIASRSET